MSSQRDGPSTSRGRKRLKVESSSSQPMSSELQEILSRPTTSTQESNEAENIDEVINSTVSWLAYHNTQLLPIRKAEILEQLKETSQCRGKKGEDYLKIIGDKLSQVFGLELIHVDAQRYIIVNKLKKKLFETQVDNTTLLLMIILTTMFRPNFTVSEEELNGVLKQIGIQTDAHDRDFDEVSKHLQMFERQCYIVKKVSSDEAKKVNYEWGIRAHKEIGKRAVFKNFCSIFRLKPDKAPQMFKELLSDNEEEEMEACSSEQL